MGMVVVTTSILERPPLSSVVPPLERRVVLLLRGGLGGSVEERRTQTRTKRCFVLPLNVKCKIPPLGFAGTVLARLTPCETLLNLAEKKKQKKKKSTLR